MSARVYSDEYESPLVIWAPPTTGNSLARVLSYQYGAQMEKAIFPSDQFTVEEAIDDGLVALRISRDLGNMGAFEHGMPVNRVLVTHFITRRLTLAEADGDAGVADDTVSIRPYSGAVAESARRRAYRRRRWRGRRTRPYMSTGRAVYGCTWSSQGTKVGPCGHRDGHIGILDQLDGHERSSFRFWSASSSTPTRMTSDAIDRAENPGSAFGGVQVFCLECSCSASMTKSTWFAARNARTEARLGPSASPLTTSNRAVPLRQRAASLETICSDFDMASGQDHDLQTLNSSNHELDWRYLHAFESRLHTSGRASVGQAAPPSWKSVQRASTDEAAQSHADPP
eukprot:CAMPEP_0174735780 /NCGR_PEP_ID=MMETSP1094-20130205/65550_1 /TAXON_ID=156173 /ORGANISM="Chrysochromulina brevifilum, Strain UTEX LB 985" /LENGTH=340 /DNA_ID=CAMNT_0015938781 /DNA_START=24 /DNA_END=1045 /DNA_ORIENTATION=-